MNKTTSSLVKALKREEKAKEEELKFLISCSKPLSDLVVEEKFLIENVLSETHGTFYAPSLVSGGRSPVHEMGYISILHLEVLPISENIPIRKLNFKGFSTLRVGDYISVKIPRYEEKIIRTGILSENRFNSQLRLGGNNLAKRTFYLDREFKAQESAIEINILSVEDTTLRVERAVDYFRFLPKK